MMRLIELSSEGCRLKQVLITGASTGIGYCLAKDLCAQGHQVWAGARKPEVLERLKEDFPQSMHILKLDVTKEADIENAFKEISKNFDNNSEFILVNNAGIALAGPIEGLRMETWREVFEVNTFAPIRMTQVFLPLIRKTKGRVINVGSISGLISSPFLGPYCTSKFALRSFNDSLRRELLVHGVKVVLIEPGPVRTEIWSKSLNYSEEQEKLMSPEMHEVYGKQIDSLREGVKETVHEAIPVEEVTTAMVHAIESPHPKLYYLLGKSIHMRAAMGKFLPASWIDQMLKKGF
jgi:short-subunit dehydrogenase